MTSQDCSGLTRGCEAKKKLDGQRFQIDTWRSRTWQKSTETSKHWILETPRSHLEAGALRMTRIIRARQVKPNISRH
jgi:hypothetical protein